MAKKIIRTGTTADPTGDSLKNAFTKVNENFTELYNALGLDEGGRNLDAFEFTGSVISTTDSSDIVIDQATTITSNLSVGGDILPQTANGGDLGSSSLPWKNLYVAGNITGNLIGNVTGNVAGNVTGNLTGNVVGNLTGRVTGNVTGNLTGDVTGNVVGNTNGYHTGDIKGSVFGDDSSILVDAVSNSIYAETGSINDFSTNRISLTTSGELRPSSTTYDAALAGWESFRSEEAATAALLGITAEMRPFIEWHVNGSNVAAYLAELDRVWVIQNTMGATLVWTPPISSSLRAQMRAAMQIVQNAYSSVAAGVSVAAGYNKSWHFSKEGDLTIPGDIKSQGNINIEINLADSTLRRWQFGEDGALTFPDGTNQTTAYQKVAVPANSYGVAGNQTDMLAFDADYIYYCFGSFRPLVTYTAAVSTSGGSTFEVYQTAGTPLIGDRLYGSTVGVNTGGVGRITNVQASTEGGQPTWLLTIEQLGAGSVGLTINQTCTIGTPDIWKRTAHGTVTW